MLNKCWEIVEFIGLKVIKNICWIRVIQASIWSLIEMMDLCCSNSDRCNSPDWAEALSPHPSWVRILHLSQIFSPVIIFYQNLFLIASINPSTGCLRIFSQFLTKWLILITNFYLLSFHFKQGYNIGILFYNGYDFNALKPHTNFWVPFHKNSQNHMLADMVFYLLGR